MVGVAASLRLERRRRHGCLVVVLVVSFAAPRCLLRVGRSDVNEQNVIVRSLTERRNYYFCLFDYTHATLKATEQVRKFHVCILCLFHIYINLPLLYY